MKKKAKQAFIPQEREDTIRHKIISIISGQLLSAKEISLMLRYQKKKHMNTLSISERPSAKADVILSLRFLNAINAVLCSRKGID